MDLSSINPDISSIGFTIPSKKTNLSVRLTNTAQLEGWLQSELKAWNWVTIEENKVPGWISGNGDISPFMQIARITETIRDLNNFKPSNTEDELLYIISEFKSAVDESKYFQSESSLGIFLIEEGNSNPEFGLKLLEAALNQDRKYIPSDRQELLAVFALNDFQRGFSKKRLKSSIDKSEEITSKLRTLEKQMVGIKNSNQKDLDDFKAAMKKEISLKEPIDYWTQKATDHEKAKNWWGRAFAAYVSIVIALLAISVLGFGGGIQGFIASWKDSGIGAVATFAGLIGIGMVIARVLYRLFASQLHLWNDARERVTMIQTYLALEAEGHVKEEFLGALLQRLFSPSSDGIVKSDLGAVGPTDALLKLLGNK